MSDDEYEEEIVCVELSGLIDCKWSNFVGKKCKFISLDSDEVVLQLGKHIFQGSYKESIGTRILISEEESHQNNDILKTYKLLDMQKIFVQEKSDDTAGPSDQVDEANKINRGEELLNDANS